MIGKPYSPVNPTVYTSPWDAYSDPTAQIAPSSSLSPTTAANGVYLDALLNALSRYLNGSSEAEGAATESVESDEFRMYEFKVRGCTRAKAHDWTECPFAHPGEKARRRDPRRRPYSGTACAEFRKGACQRGDDCEFAHGVFESWLHPTRYRTQACKDGPGCTRRVCFFAHSPGQLRAASGPSDPVVDMAARLRSLQLSKVNSMPTGRVGNGHRAGFYSQPGTPTGSLFRAGGVGYPWAEEPSIENWIGIEEPVDSNAGGPGGSGPDIGWVSELVK